VLLSLSTKVSGEKKKINLFFIESNEKARIKIEEKLKCVCAPARMVKQIINFGISFQLKVTSIQHKREDRKNPKLLSKIASFFSRYAKRCFYNRKKGKKKSSFIVPFFKGFCAESSCLINLKVWF
jgi:hypothetical protein